MNFVKIITRNTDIEKQREEIEKTKKECDESCDNTYDPAQKACWDLFGPGKITVEELQIMERCAETVQANWDRCLQKCQDAYDAAIKALEGGN